MSEYKAELRAWAKEQKALAKKKPQLDDDEEMDD